MQNVSEQVREALDGLPEADRNNLMVLAAELTSPKPTRRARFGGSMFIQCGKRIGLLM
jgi:hypothetical protein